MSIPNYTSGKVLPRECVRRYEIKNISISIKDFSTVNQVIEQDFHPLRGKAHSARQHPASHPPAGVTTGDDKRKHAHGAATLGGRFAALVGFHRFCLLFGCLSCRVVFGSC